ncbi:MAG: hypothetical protein RL701_6122 [Pseudomonadota bacterium]
MKVVPRTMHWLSLVLTSLILAPGCGASSGGGSQPQSVSTVAGAGGSTPAAPSNADRPKSVECGANTCIQLEQTGFAIPRVCCFDAAEGRCSAIGTNNKCQAPAVVDPRCPDAPVFNMVLKGCCTSGGMCGLDSSGVGMGCKDVGDPSFRMLAPGLPEPRRCDAAMDSDDGGTAGGGGK